ncbi:TPA: hypothetical protein QCY14_004905 [Bacillus pacificus]|nr:hypothetical protein [Bacillus pacificus]
MILPNLYGVAYNGKSYTNQGKRKAGYPKLSQAQQLIYQESWDIARDEFRKKNSTVNFDNLSAQERLSIVEDVQKRFEIIEYAPQIKPAP